MPATTTELGRILKEAGLITDDQLREALGRQDRSGERLGAVLVGMGAVTENELTRALGEQLGIPVFDPSRGQIQREAISLVPLELARKYDLLPISIQGGALQVAMTDPLDLDAMDDLRVVSGLPTEAWIAARGVVKEIRERHYGRLHGSQEVLHAVARASLLLTDEAPSEEVDDAEAIKRSEDAPIINLVDQIIGQAVGESATDIHVEPHPEGLVIRFRVDGLLHDAITPPRSVYTGVMTRIKILADLDISERRAPQDGGFVVKTRGHEVDIRVSTIPSVHGEKAVLRLLDKSAFSFSLSNLGFEEHDLRIFSRAIRRPHGMILLSGPTGSGKSTTLYAALMEINDTALNVLSIEDPVEYQIPRVNQVQVNPRKGVTFATALRSFLRQDPDVIMVGEIRDRETGEMSVRAAMTGHLVLSTIHANDAPTTAARLLSLGADPFQIASALNLVAAQRLVRRVCPVCAEPSPPREETLLAFARFGPPDGAVFLRGRGCGECKHRGFRGRTAILELMPLDRALRELVAAGAPTDSLREAALARGMHSLMESGFAKASRGQTTLEEVLRVCHSED